MKIKTQLIWEFISENRPLPHTELETYKKELEDLKKYIKDELGVEVNYIFGPGNSVLIKSESTVIDNEKFVFWTLKQS